jgi:hypothetical protein
MALLSMTEMGAAAEAGYLDAGLPLSAGTGPPPRRSLCRCGVVLPLAKCRAAPRLHSLGRQRAAG